MLNIQLNIAIISSQIGAYCSESDYTLKKFPATTGGGRAPTSPLVTPLYPLNLSYMHAQSRSEKFSVTLSSTESSTDLQTCC